MATISTDQLAERMSKRLANFALGDAVIKEIASRVAIDGLRVVRFDPCIYGICMDYTTSEFPRLDQFVPERGISKWEVFPYGIIEWDQFHVRVAFQVDQLEGKGIVRGFAG